MKQIDLKIEYTGAGTWMVTSPNIPGLLAGSGTIPDALEEAAKAIRDLALAVAIALSEGQPAQPIFC